MEGRQLRGFAELVGLSEELDHDGLLDEARLWSPGQATDELRRRLAAVFRTRSAAEWTRVANPIADLSECQTTTEWLDVNDEQAHATESVIGLRDPELGETRQAGYAFQMSRTPLQARAPRSRLANVEGLAGVDRLTGANLQRELSERFAHATAETWVGRLTSIGRGAHVVVTQAECMEDAWARAHGLSVERDDPQLGRVFSAGPSGRMSRTPPVPMPTPHSPGGDNLEVLAELGLGDTYAALLAEGVIANSVRSTVARATPVRAPGSPHDR